MIIIYLIFKGFEHPYVSYFFAIRNLVLVRIFFYVILSIDYTYRRPQCHSLLLNEWEHIFFKINFIKKLDNIRYYAQLPDNKKTTNIQWLLFLRNNQKKESNSILLKICAFRFEFTMDHINSTITFCLFTTIINNAIVYTNIVKKKSKSLNYYNFNISNLWQSILKYSISMGISNNNILD